MRHWVIRLGISAALALVLAPTAFAQTGKITGRVIDRETGDPLPGASVIIDGTSQGAAADMDGGYTILNVRPGTYAIRASLIGFAAQTVEGVRVLIDKTTEQDFVLGEEVFEGEEVVVVAERALVQRDLTSSSVSVSSEELASLPVQSFSDVVNLQAGVVDGHFRGGRTGEVAYLVDGVPVNDVFDQSFAFQVENNAIQEIEIISGTFNAEYGQAQSGVVNIVTRDGGSSFEGSVSGYVGDYLTSETTLFERDRTFSPTGSYEAQGALSGPILGDRLTFFGSGRFVRNDGYLWGRRVVEPIYTPTDQRQEVQVQNPDGTMRSVFVPALGDSSLVSMNWSQQATAQLKLTARITPVTTLRVNGLLQKDEGQNYDHLFRFNPGGIPTVYGSSQSVIATLNQVFGSKSFADLKLAYFANAVDEYVYEDPLDARYPSDAALRELRPSFSYFLGGARMTQFRRETTTAVARLDFTSQIAARHLMKLGVEGKRHTLTLDDFEVKNNAGTGFEPGIPPAGTPDHVAYEQEPFELSAYVQDKMEFDYLVLNVGVRLDYFDARAEVPSDFTRPRTSERRQADTKWQVSPRLGLAFPLSERGIVHVAYGHFFQMPPFSFLYTNPDYIYDPEQGLGRPFGYADLEPEQTVAYEIGLQQAFTDALGLDVTLYYKTIRNLLGTRLETIAAGAGEDFQLSRYGRFVNRDYGQVKGLIVSFEKRGTTPGSPTLNVDYTFQIARGNASDPRDALLAEQGGNEPTKQLVPLDWDRRHQLNLTTTLGDASKGLGLVSLIGRLGSGLPYTPSASDERTGLENSARRPASATFDLFASRTIGLGGLFGDARPGLFLRVYNLLDTQNVTNVYTDTGRPEPNLRFYSGQPLGLNTKTDFLRRPDFYAAPRQVTLGASLTF